MAFSSLKRCLLPLALITSLWPADAPKTPRPQKEVLRGYLVDLVCVKEEAGKIPDLGPNHTKKCLLMPACIQGGYALLLPSNQVLAFDQHGNELARKMLASYRQEKGITVKVAGSREGEIFHVLRIE